MIYGYGNESLYGNMTIVIPCVAFISDIFNISKKDYYNKYTVVNLNIIDIDKNIVIFVLIPCFLL